MKKLILFVLFLLFILVACQTNDNKGFLDVNISKVNISKSNGFGKLNSDFFIVYQDKESLDIFNNAISTAVKREGVADMAEPEFDLKVSYTGGNKQGFHLWLGENGQKSTIMKVNDTHITYSISEEMTDQLIDLLK